MFEDFQITGVEPLLEDQIHERYQFTVMFKVMNLKVCITKEKFTGFNHSPNSILKMLKTRYIH